MQDNVSVYHVGDIRITRIDETSFPVAPEKLFPKWDESAEPLIKQRFAPATIDLVNRRVPLQSHLWAVEIAGLTIVVDTGIGNGKSRPFNSVFDHLDIPLMQRFEAAGFSPQQVDYVLLTHLHVDHVGWNTHWRDNRWAATFPNARYLLGQSECDFLESSQGNSREVVFEDSIRPLIDSNHIQLVPDKGVQVAPGIRFIPAPGHSIGHMVIEFQSHGETVLFSGDVMHSPVQVYYPHWSSAFCLDQAQARASRHWLLGYAADTGATVFPAHFPETTAGKITRHGQGFEWSYYDQ